jgi:hypothetical protein
MPYDHRPIAVSGRDPSSRFNGVDGGPNAAAKSSVPATMVAHPKRTWRSEKVLGV